MPGVPQSILVGWLVLHFAFAITQGAFAGFIGLDQQGCATPQRWICGTPLEPLTTAVIDFEFGIGIILEVFSLVKNALITIFRLVILDYEILYWGGPLGVVSGSSGVPQILRCGVAQSCWSSPMNPANAPLSLIHI